jgi:hypothetical protein
MTQRLVFLSVILAFAPFRMPAAAQTSVTTYHNDNYRTGWNKTESVLTPATVWSPNFDLVHTVTLNDQVDAQPLMVPGVLITAGNYQGTHDVVYVATESNTVYAIDTHTGTVLLSPSFGSPVPSPLSCNNNGPNLGITSTPVIDLASKTLYVMTYTNDGPTYRLHALDLGSLTDKVAPQVVTASHPLYPGGTFTFNAKYQRQRPALLLANGNIYAGFGSFCDKSSDVTRGWLLGWTEGSLAPLPANQLLDYQETDIGNDFLSSIWMSGYGPATDDAGNILVVTGNSDMNADTYDGTTDIQESVVKVSSTLSSVLDLFTPSDQWYLDQHDIDFGSGGVMVLPDQPGSIPHMAVAAGKEGNLFLMNVDHLGGFSSSGNNVLGTYPIGNCWCGESYYVDPADGAGRVVTSGGTGNPVDGPALANQLELWKVQTNPTVGLSEVGSVQIGGSGQGPGFFTSISSNGQATPVIWAISRPFNVSPYSVNLFAFDPDSGGPILTQLLKTGAGTWPNWTGNANLVPLVANGQVYVASYKQLQVFGLTANNLRVEKTAGTGTDVGCSYPSYPPTYWSPTSAVSVLGGYATAEVGNSPKGLIKSQCLYATGFNFSVPANATILGVQVSFLAYVYAGGTPPTNFTAQLLSNGSPTGTVNSTGYVSNTAGTRYTFGGWNSLWGTTWTPAGINQSNFGVTMQATPQAGSLTGTAALGGVQITVFYTP